VRVLNFVQYTRADLNYNQEIATPTHPAKFVCSGWRRLRSSSPDGSNRFAVLFLYFKAIETKSPWIAASCVTREASGAWKYLTSLGAAYRQRPLCAVIGYSSRSLGAPSRLLLPSQPPGSARSTGSHVRAKSRTLHHAGTVESH